ncbi:carbohydrate-binding family V/XII [Halioglobus maricola]|uniref:carbohydrate-binding family V/XII n=1 Tax=Halioglobus maricola TaxID=2601894 RepID=UPI00197AEC9D|nr:carbohydrate-binding family V/XII [Halioglobus maricola]
MTTLRPLFFTLLTIFSCHAFAIDWPQQVTVDEGILTVYQPQPESLSGNTLQGRAAMSITPKGKSEQIFGAFWFESRVETDRSSDTALVVDIKVTKVRWPDSKDAQEQRFTALVEAAVPSTGFEISLERLAASLNTAELETKSLEQLNNDPPAIVFREKLAVLLMYDGSPRYGDIENSDYQRVLNTPIAVVKNTRGTHYATNGTLWYVADSALGPWRPTTSPPKDLAEAMPAPDADAPSWDTPPEIVVATSPTELIVTQGAPEWKPLTGGELLYVTNTESPWLRDLPTGNMYLLLSGRWYRSKSTKGPWTFVPADELPTSFANIPPASDIGGLRTSVAGTPEAEEAVLDAQIPQTAAISRDTTLEVSYDGEPSFEPVTGTSVSYAVNTATQVLKIDGRYYAVDNGVWFTATNPKGPWAVADDIPKEKIAEIPPSSPVYNTTYVNVYDSTPEVVYVGYTPGYMWSFPYYGVPVYGSGWYYRPWPGRWYYPHHPTWGFHVGYNPWTGWSFGVSWTNGFLSFGARWGGGYPYRHPGRGWYGGGYRGPVVINTGDINIGNNVNVGNRADISKKIKNNDVKVNRDRLRSDNLYTRKDNQHRLADPGVAQRDIKKARPNNKLQNNVYADRDGKVSRNVDNQWESLDKGSWKADKELNNKVSKPSTREVQKPSTSHQQRPSTANRQHEMERARQARTRGSHSEARRPTQRREFQRRR